MKLFSNILCCFFGHKADKHMLAYNIESYPVSYEVKIYDLARCSSCGSYYSSLIDQYQRYVWYTQPAIEHEEKRLREQHIVSVLEAYKLLRKVK